MKPFFQASLLFVSLGILNPAAVAQTITTYAGPPLPVSGQPAVRQAVDKPSSVAVDSAGGFFVTSSAQNRVYQVSANGTLTLVAGSGNGGYSGDGGPAIS